MKNLRANLRCYRFSDGDDPFNLFQQEKMSKGALLMLIEKIVNETTKVAQSEGLAEEDKFWEYWKQRWPHASCDSKVLERSVNYQETRKAFFAGYSATQPQDSTDKNICDCNCLWCAQCPYYNSGNCKLKND